MADLYLIFFAVGLLLFAAIVGFSYLQKRKSPGKADPIPSSEASTDRSQEAIAAQSQHVDDDLSESVESNSEPSLAQKASSAAGKREPSIKTPSSAQQARPESLTAMEPSLAQPSQAPIVERVNAERPNNSSPQSGVTKSTAKGGSLVTELVARIKNTQPIEQQGLLVLFRKHDFKFHRNVHIYGLNELTEMWRDIEFELPSARFTELGVAIQLADREGAMSKKELHDFQQMVLEFTDTYDAPFEFSMDIDEALKQAESLDQLGRRYDSMAVLNVVPRSKTGFRLADIESCARDLMMATDKNGIFMKTRGHKTQQSILYRLACTDGSGHFGISGGAPMPVHDLVVYMNVPATEDPELVFQDMVKDANSLATWLDGKVVDRGGRVMTQRSYSTLMQQVSDIAFSMQQDGLMPGDAISKKLF